MKENSENTLKEKEKAEKIFKKEIKILIKNIKKNVKICNKDQQTKFI